MARDAVKAKPAWYFAFGNGSSIQVHYGTGHWAQVMNTTTGERLHAIYVYESTITYADGSTSDVPISKANLRDFRSGSITAIYKSDEQAAQEGGGDGA